MIAEAIPGWLQVYVDKINNLGVLADKKANHVLVNEYLSGQGIMPHTDGSLFHPIISTISCGSHTVLELEKCREESEADIQTQAAEEKIQILVERRSLLMIKDDAYHKYLHSIAERTEDEIAPSVSNIHLCEMVHNGEEGQVLHREKRISLTIRHVPKTTKLKLKFG